MEMITEIKVSGIFVPGNGSLKKLVEEIKELESKKNVKCSLIHAEALYTKAMKKINHCNVFCFENKWEPVEGEKTELRVTSEFTLLWDTWTKLIEEAKEIEKEYNCHCTLIQAAVIQPSLKHNLE